MNGFFFVLTETLRTLCYLTLFLDISSRVMVWFGADRTYTGVLLTAVSDMLAFPFRRLLKRFTDRYPFFDRLPWLCGTVFIYLLAESIPKAELLI